MAKQKLMTKAIEKQLPALYATDKIPLKDKKVIVKFFCPTSNWTWYAFEYNPADKMFYGIVDGHELEQGYFSLREFEDLNVQFYAGRSRVWIERDYYFGTPIVGEIRELQGRLR